jgi:hypothetical protein
MSSYQELIQNYLTALAGIQNQINALSDLNPFNWSDKPALNKRLIEARREIDAANNAIDEAGNRATKAVLQLLGIFQAYQCVHKLRVECGYKPNAPYVELEHQLYNYFLETKADAMVSVLRHDIRGASYDKQFIKTITTVLATRMLFTLNIKGYQELKEQAGIALNSRLDYHRAITALVDDVNRIIRQIGVTPEVDQKRRQISNLQFERASVELLYNSLQARIEILIKTVVDHSLTDPSTILKVDKEFNYHFSGSDTILYLERMLTESLSKTAPIAGSASQAQRPV